MPSFPVRPPSLEALPSYLTAQVAKAASRLLTEELAGFGVRPHHFAVMAALRDFGPQCQQDLCDRLDLDKSHMVGFVDDLEAMGHVARTRDPEDRRRHRVAITASGESLLESLLDIDVRFQERMFGVLTVEQRAALVEMLQSVVAAVDRQRLDAAHPEVVSA